MKKILLVAAIALFGLTANAQEKENKGLEGKWLVAGKFSFSSYEEVGTKTTSNTILPVAGYFVSPDVTLGLGIGVIGSKEETTVGTTTTTTNDVTALVIQPLVRKYWGLGGKFYFFGQASLPITMGKDKLSDDKVTSFGVDIAPGFDFIVNKWMTVETTFSLVNLTSTSTNPNVGDSTSDFSFNANPFDLNPGNRSVGGLRVGVKFLF